ncbi:MAG: OmpA family protein [Flavobacteriales bacterium]
MIKYLFSLAGIMFGLSVSAQFNIEDRVKNKVNQRIERKIDEGIDKTLDNTEEEAKKAAKGGKKDKGQNQNEEAAGSENGADGETSNNGTNTPSNQKATLKTYSKFDFIPGENIIASDDFSNVEIGDYPIDWNTNSGGEIVTVDGLEGKWFQLSRTGVYMPEYITDLPENFTLEYDLICNEGFSYYSTPFATWFTALENPSADFVNHGRFDSQPHGVRVELHPKGTGSDGGSTYFINYDADGRELIKNDVRTDQFNSSNGNTKIHVSIWRQKTRLRVYVNQDKVLDLPRAFNPGTKYNRIVFSRWESSDNDLYLFSNLRLAVGAPDTRSKLITEGKLVTRGILFDVASDKIKPESFGTLKDIAKVLTENPDVKVKIIGHTDSDGEDSKNLDLSKRRAASVKDALVKEFNIDAKRLETDGKGESEPVDKNDTPVGKANNRRVEFIKL